MDNIFYEIIFIFDDKEQIIFSSQTTPITIQEHSKLTSSVLFNFENFGEEYDSVIRISTDFNSLAADYKALKNFCENVAKKKKVSKINNIIIKNSNNEEYFNYNANQIVDISGLGNSEIIDNNMVFHYVLNIFVKG